MKHKPNKQRDAYAFDPEGEDRVARDGERISVPVMLCDANSLSGHRPAMSTI
jgi:hypothetical protein